MGFIIALSAGITAALFAGIVLAVRDAGWRDVKAALKINNQRHRERRDSI